MIFLSQLMQGINDGVLEMKEPLSVYRLMLGIQPASLQKDSDRPLSKEELDIARAVYIRSQLPDLK
jgi:protein arginine kinase